MSQNESEPLVFFLNASLKSVFLVLLMGVFMVCHLVVEVCLLAFGSSWLVVCLVLWRVFKQTA